jgi:CheY-like chemotaxis protein
MATPLPNPKPGPQDVEPALAPHLNIVALDDDDDFRQYLSGILETDGHELRAVATPDAFFTACEERLPDIVLLDIKMGRYSGEDVLVQIRNRWPKLGVVVVTGYPSLEGMRQTFKQDAFDYLAKPFSLAELRRTLAQAAASLGLGRRPEDRLRAEGFQVVGLEQATHSEPLFDFRFAARTVLVVGNERTGLTDEELARLDRVAEIPMAGLPHSLNAATSAAIAVYEYCRQWPDGGAAGA